MKKAQSLVPALVRTFKVSSLAAATALAISQPAHAFQFEKGEWQGSLDTTLSYGLGVRVESQDKRLIGRANGGTAYSVNGDDGNLNFEDGDVFSNAIKISSELELTRGNWGAFVRVNALYDDVIANDRVSRRPLGNLASPLGADTTTGKRKFSSDADDLAGQRIELFDAYLFGDLEVGERQGGWKLGNQVLSWGESTFIQNSINTVNPIDVSKIRVPGAELKEALVPVPLLSGTMELTENTSIEAFYQLKSEPFRIDPTGTLLSTNDFAGEGGFEHGVFLRFADVSDGNDDFFSATKGLGADGIPDFKVQRSADEDARDDGQFGLAYRVYAPSLNDTEFGFYFMNYHSRLPVISGVAPSQGRVQAATRVADAAYAQATASGNPALAPDQVAGAAYINALLSGDGAASYFLEYPEDIQLYGVSFNTTLGSSGVALQGELSHRTDVPLQIDDVELLVAVLGATQAEVQNNLAGTGSLVASSLMGTFRNGNVITRGGDLTLGQRIAGYIQRDVSQFQTTATKAFSNVAGADRLILIGEAGFNYVHDMPSSREVPLDVNGTYLSNNAGVAARLHPCPKVGQSKCASRTKAVQSFGSYADDFSWGYVVAGRLEYSNAIGAVNLKPKFSYRHDVEGRSPGPGGSFLEGRKAFTIGADFDYQLKWSGGISYTNFFGGGEQNVISDRDFVALNAKYSF